MIGFGSLLPLTKIGFAAVAVLAVLLGVQTWRLDRCQQEFALFQERVRAEGEAAARRAKEIEERHRRIKDDADKQLASARARINDLSRQLRDARAGSGYLPAPAASAASTDRTCFDRTELERALRQLDEEVSGIVAEGDQARVALDAAREWAAKIR
jgi:hypothetical protein